jgi:hypothetical protein
MFIFYTILDNKKPTTRWLWVSENCNCRYSHLFENFFIALNALFGAFVRRVAVYLLRTQGSSGLLYAAGGNFM